MLKQAVLKQAVLKRTVLWVVMTMLVGACGGSAVSAGPVQVLRQEAAAQPATSVVVAVEVSRSECDDEANLAIVASEATALDMLRVAAELAAATDAACGAPDDLDRQCRALFFLSSTEPTLVWADGGDWAASLAVWQFAVDDGAASSSPELGLMWAKLRAFTDGLSGDLAAEREAAIAARVVARADVNDDLSILQDGCAAS